MCYYFIIYYLTDYVEIFSFDTALKYFLSTFQVFTFFYLCFSSRRRDEIVCGSKINISRKDFSAKPLAIPETVQFSEPWFQPMWRMNHLIIFNRQYSKNCLGWSFFFLWQSWTFLWYEYLSISCWFYLFVFLHVGSLDMAWQIEFSFDMLLFTLVSSVRHLQGN